jgi:hypothetical protein
VSTRDNLAGRLQRLAVATHEAGHAVAAHTFGYDRVHVVANADGNGWCTYDIPAIERETRDGVLRQLAVTYAGPLAEALLTRHATAADYTTHALAMLAARTTTPEPDTADDDTGEALAIVAASYDRTADPTTLIPAAITLAHQTVTAHWHDIQHTAATILQHLHKNPHGGCAWPLVVPGDVPAGAGDGRDGMAPDVAGRDGQSSLRRGGW